MMSYPFYITNRTRQGCPLSPLIFKLLTEPLASFVRVHPDIHGVILGNKSHVINLFADDIILMLSDVKSSLPAVYNVLQMFQTSLYYVNASKWYVLDLGIYPEIRHSLMDSYPFVWRDKGIGYLGNYSHEIHQLTIQS